MSNKMTMLDLLLTLDSAHFIVGKREGDAFKEYSPTEILEELTPPKREANQQ